jgi:multiple sugar transport system permease protein
MIASLLNMKIKYLSLFRTLFYIPSIIPTISAALLWIWILNGQYGILNTILGFVGLPQPGWLTDPNFTKISLIIMQVWGSGGIMVIYLAAIQDIPKSLYESSVIDGANSIQKFLKITIPSLAPVTLFQTIIATSAAFQYFAQAYIFSFGMDIHRSVGGPENSILFYSVYLYQNAFSFLKMGYASAMAWILFIIISLITYTIFRISDKSVYYGGE